MVTGRFTAARLRSCSYRSRRGCEQRVACKMQIYAPIWRVAFEKRGALGGFSRGLVQPSPAAQRGHEAPQAAQRPCSARRWPVSRLPSQAAPSHERNGTLGHEPSARALSTLPARRRGLARARQLWTTSPLCNAKSSSERGPHYRALPRSEADTNARRSGRRHKGERPHAHRANQRPGQPQRASQGQPRCHPAPSPGPSA